MDSNDDDDECPFHILGLRVDANEHDINKRWKQLMLSNHPDKNSDSKSNDISKRLNDAKDRAMAIRQSIMDHVEELKGYTKTELLSDNKYFELLRSQVKTMYSNLKAETTRFAVFDAFIGGYYRLVYDLKESISTLEDSIAEEKASSQQAAEQYTSKISTLTTSLTAAQEELKVERSRNEETSKTNGELILTQDQLTLERDAAILEIEQLKRERDEAISKANTLRSERDEAIAKANALRNELDEAISKASELSVSTDAKINELITERDSAKRERDEAISKLSKSNENEGDNNEDDEDEETPMPSTKKRKHRKLLSSKGEQEAFENTVSQFIESKIKISPQSFITPRQIINEFKKDGHDFPSETLFFKELRNQLNHMIPVCTYRSTNGIRKYDGITFK